MRGDVKAKLNDVFLNTKTDVSFEQQDKAIKKQLKIIRKLQKRVKEEQRRKNQLASQLKRSLQLLEELKQ
ncbi:hypothetical protein A5821_001606 [Enterococcus sp. 7F3_DIV0205]|uniref:Uncharacterized protein n=1 Tax=Candidatus Enterococcus palustris TaxID=1834189 RepID=A0AAQ3W848_9ENTE|nr:hypothetical protein [Enterococcus sp. 7F3_DIV0205]OTN86001.1 hypothetical protein A5821_001951 [Enterococcus sp. 7F3_DIV0205]